jgi:hypothetical protein
MGAGAGDAVGEIRCMELMASEIWFEEVAASDFRPKEVVLEIKAI